MSVQWVFPSSNGGTDKGFNDAGIETFTGARYDSLAREIIQNSLDAAIDNNTKVTVEFDFLKIARDDFPGAKELLKVMNKCLAENQGNTKAKKFFEDAIKVLNKKDIPCLKISDSGTTGLRGDYRRREGKWYAITKAEGVSEKADSTAGGSYGIGKSAPFVVSSLRTVFYSTIYEESGQDVMRAQGKSILVSHKINGNEYTQAVGFYGEKKGCMPIEGDIPAILRPQKQGCVVFIPGFIAQKNWMQEIMASVVANFFCAINDNKLDILLRDENKNIEMIKQKNLDKCFKEIEQLQSLSEKTKNPYYYYQVMKSDKCMNKELNHFGHCKIWVQVNEGLPKRFALLRKTGMLITDEQDGLKRWSGYADFAAVFVCDSDKGNALLREMENPQHNAFEPDRAIDKQLGKKALSYLANKLRGFVSDVAKADETEVSQIDELKEFFPDIAPDETIPGDGNEPDIEGDPVYSPKPLKKDKPRSDPTDENGGDGGGAGKGNDKDNNNGSGDGDSTGGGGDQAPRKIAEIENVRVASNTKNSKKKTVFFTLEKKGEIQLALAISGDDGRTDNVSITEASGDDGNFKIEEVKNGNVKLSVQSETTRIALQVSLDKEITDSLVVKAFQIDANSEQ